MESTVLHSLEQAEADMFRLLERLVLQSSHSSDKAGVDKVGHIIRSALQECRLDLTVQHAREHGDNLIFRTQAACTAGFPSLLLVGHMDTVFPPDSSFNTYREDDVNAYGPGVCDMKGGLVTAIYVLKALHAAGSLQHIPITFICNADEEIGSPDSTEIIKAYAEKCCAALVFECGGLHGEVVTGRKGKCGYLLEVVGKAGHAAFSTAQSKASAILELAHKVIALEGLNDAGRQMVVNVGKISGGSAANVVAQSSSALLDTRYVTDEDGLFLRAAIARIAAESSVPGTMANVSVTSGRMPMMQSAANLALYQILRQQADLLGFCVRDEARSGVSDANTIAQCRVPVVDGLGPVGSLDHSEDEFIVKETLLQRCQLTASTVLAIWKRQMKICI